MFISDTMADMNIPVNDAPAVQAHVVAPPTRTDDQILPLSKTPTSSRPSHHPLRFRLSTFSSFGTPCALIRLLGCTVVRWMSNSSIFTKIFSEMLLISLQPMITIPLWLHRRVIQLSSMSTLWDTPTFLTDWKNLATAARGKKKTAHLLIPSVRFTKLIIHHLRTKHTIHPRTGSPLHYSHEESILNTLRFVGKDGREIFGMPIPDALITDEIKGAPYYGDYQEHVAKYQQFLDVERGKAEEGGATESSDATKVTKPKAAKVTKPAGDKAPKPTATQPPKPKLAPTQPSKAVSKKKQKLVKETPDEPSLAKRSKGGLVGKRCKPKSPLKLVDEPNDEGVPVEEPAHTDEEADLQRALELSLKEQAERTQGPARLVVLREPDSGKYQPHPKVQGKGKEKVIDEQAAHDLLTLQTLTKKSPVDQFIFQRRPPMHTEPTGHADSPSLNAELPLTDSEMESDKEVPAGPNPGIQDEGQAGSNPGDVVQSQPQQRHGVHVGPNLEHMDIEATDASTQKKPEQMDEEFTITAYPNVQKNLKLPIEDHFFVEKRHEEESGKTNAEIEVQSMVSVPIHQDTSSIPPMTTPAIDLTTMQSDSPLPTSTATTLIITTTTSLPPPPQPQQSTANLILVSRIGELEQHMGDLIQNNLVLEESALQARFKDLPTVDMKEILQQRMFEDNSYKSHEVHNDLYEALQKSLELDYSNQRLADKEEARKKKRKKHAAPRTPSGSPPSPPPPPPPPAGASSASDSGNDHLPKADSRQDWWKPLSKEERPMTLEPAWTIPSSNVSDNENNWASALVSTYETPVENSLLAKTRDMTTFIKWHHSPSVPNGGVSQDAYSSDLEYLRYSNKGSNHALSIFKMKAVSYPDFGPELLKFYVERHDSPSRRKDVRTHMRIFSVVRIKAYSRYGQTDTVKLWTRNLVIRQRVEDFQLGIKSYQTQLNLTKPGWDATCYEFKHDYTIIESPQAVVFPVDKNDRKIMRFNEIYKFSDGTLTRILEALDYRVKEFKVKRLNPDMNT
ncbi:retrovirus-related pol polyprotein from transposon TNT 1-94 [Tanacetum coccineum]